MSNNTTVTTIYLPRPKNRNYPPNIVPRCAPGLRIIELNITKNRVFIEEFLRQGTKAEKLSLIINKLTTLGIDRKSVIYRDYDDTSQQLQRCSFEHAADSIYTKCVKRKSELNFKLMNYIPVDQYNKSTNHQNKSTPTADDTQSPRKRTKINLNDTIADVVNQNNQDQNELLKDLQHEGEKECYINYYLTSQTIDQVDTIEKTPPICMDSNKFKYYSCIHNVTESFNLYVFNGSHRQRGQTLHRSSLINIKIPAEDKFFILFHGHLLHCGAPSKLESSLRSYNYSKDCRLFCYVEKPETNSMESNKRSKRSQLQDNPNRWIVQNHEENAAISPSFSPCGYENNGNCEICRKNYRHMNNKNFPFLDNNVVLDIASIYNQMKTKQNIVSNKPTLVAGNLDKLGWVVYTGTKVNDETIGKVRMEILDLIYNSKSNWRDIEGGRKSYRTSGCIGSKAKCNEEINRTTHINAMYNDILNLCIKKIEGFEKAEILSPSIIMNDGKVKEQKIHRDYECIQVSSL